MAEHALRRNRFEKMPQRFHDKRFVMQDHARDAVAGDRDDALSLCDASRRVFEWRTINSGDAAIVARSLRPVSA
jgi:hypothetical protein